MKKEELDQICYRLDKIDLNLETHIRRTDLLEDYVKKQTTTTRWIIGLIFAAAAALKIFA